MYKQTHYQSIGRFDTGKTFVTNGGPVGFSDNDEIGPHPTYTVTHPPWIAPEEPILFEHQDFPSGHLSIIVGFIYIDELLDLGLDLLEPHEVAKIAHRAG